MPKAPLITKVTLSARKASIGESISVEVRTSEPDADVSIDGVDGAKQFVQFATPGRHHVLVTASSGSRIEQVRRRVSIEQRSNDLPLPIISATEDPHAPRVLNLLIANVQDFSSVQFFDWNFGDGTGGREEFGRIPHDFTNGLERDRLHTSFDIRVDAHNRDGSVSSGIRTVSLFHLYAYNKHLAGVLAPRVTIRSDPNFVSDKVECEFYIQNLEDEDIVFSDEQHDWLMAPVPATESQSIAIRREGVAVTRPVAAATVREPVDPRTEALTVVRPATVPPRELLRVPARATAKVVRSLPSSDFVGDAFGVAVHLRGMGVDSRMPAIASAYLEVRLPLNLGWKVSDPGVHQSLNSLARITLKERIGHQEIMALLPTSPGDEPRPIERMEPFGRAMIGVPEREGAGNFEGPGQEIQSPHQIPPFLRVGNPAAHIARLLDPPRTSSVRSGTLTFGEECDPENMPDTVPEGAVCQRTGERAWRFVPGRILNARKGDIVLSPGNSGFIGLLLRTVGQYHSHSGIMTKNYIELRHSTASEEWLRDHLNGTDPFTGKKGTDGFEEQALKYLWPGTVTQSIDQATYGQWLTSPEGTPYKVSSFSYTPNRSIRHTLAGPYVVKPHPFDDPKVRNRLHAIADAALAINGHYRFYCFTKPEIALGPEGLAGPEAGWAEGTIATVCSSMIWLAAQHANVRLEGPTAKMATADLEPPDIRGGAEVDAGATHDGLYYYSAERRRAAAAVLYNAIVEEVSTEAGWLGTALTGAPDDAACQVCNTFASDWSDGDSKNSRRWSTTEAANAVSPDDTTFWDGVANADQFGSVYGYVEELFYRPGTYANVPVYRWRHVLTRGNLTGRVTAAANVNGVLVTLQGSGKPDFPVGDDGRFEFDDVPDGAYTASAGMNIGGYWHSADVEVDILPGTTTDITIALQPPPEVNRSATITVSCALLELDPVFASGSTGFGPMVQSVRIHPWHSHEHLRFHAPEGEPYGQMDFDIDLNPDLSISVGWVAEVVDGGTVIVSSKGGAMVPKDQWKSWTDLYLKHTNWAGVGAEAYFDFVVSNDQAPS